MIRLIYFKNVYSEQPGKRKSPLKFFSLGKKKFFSKCCRWWQFWLLTETLLTETIWLYMQLNAAVALIRGPRCYCGVIAMFLLVSLFRLTVGGLQSATLLGKTNWLTYWTVCHMQHYCCSPSHTHHGFGHFQFLFGESTIISSNQSWLLEVQKAVWAVEAFKQEPLRGAWH